MHYLSWFTRSVLVLFKFPVCFFPLLAGRFSDFYLTQNRKKHYYGLRLVLNAVSATWAIQRRPILVAFYDTHGDTEDTFYFSSKWHILSCMRSIVAHRDHFVRRLSVRLSGSHTFLVVMHSYVSQATSAFLGMLPLCFYLTSQHDYRYGWNNDILGTELKIKVVAFIILVNINIFRCRLASILAGRSMEQAGTTTVYQVGFFDCCCLILNVVNNPFATIRSRNHSLQIKYSIPNTTSLTDDGCVLCVYWYFSHMQQYFSYMCYGTDVQADWRRSWTYGRAPNAIDIS